MCMYIYLLSHIRLFAAPRIVAHQASLSMGFPRQEYWNGLPFPSPGDLLELEIEHTPPVLAYRFFSIEPPGKSYIYKNVNINKLQVLREILNSSNLWLQNLARNRRVSRVYDHSETYHNSHKMEGIPIPCHKGNTI